MHISKLYSSKKIDAIELTLQNITQPTKRNIPKPRNRPKLSDQSEELERLKVTSHHTLDSKPIKFEPAEGDISSSVLKDADMMNMPDIPEPEIYEWKPGQPNDDRTYRSADSYLEMVRLRIERYKKYPRTARLRQIEGKVTVRFIITPDGNIKSANVVKTSGNDLLDGAAIMAVKEAAPFPKVPAHLFKGEIPLKLNIVFDLT
jgi:protein TonB